MEENKVINQTTDQSYEYAFEPVPEDKKKGGLSLFVVLAGYPIALSNFVTGAAIGINMTFIDAMIAILAADAFLKQVCQLRIYQELLLGKKVQVYFHY